MMIFNYESKKELKENIGKTLNHTETSMFGIQYKREFFAEVTMQDDKIVRVK